MTVSHKTARIVVNGMSSATLLWPTLLYSFTTIAWAKLGHFPIPSVDDPKYIGLDLIHAIVILSSPIAFLSIVMWLLLLPLSIHNKLLTKWNVSLFVCGCSLMLVQVVYDPFDLICWLLD